MFNASREVACGGLEITPRSLWIHTVPGRATGRVDMVATGVATVLATTTASSLASPLDSSRWVHGAHEKVLRAEVPVAEENALVAIASSVWVRCELSACRDSTHLVTIRSAATSSLI